MGRLNVGGSGKRVEIRFMGYAKSGNSPLGINIYDKNSYNPVSVNTPEPIGLIDGHVYVYLSERKELCKMQINSNNSVTQMKRIDLGRIRQEIISSTITIVSMTVYGEHIYILVRDRRSVTPTHDKHFLIKYDKNLDIVDQDSEVNVTGLPSLIGKVHIIDGQIITTHVSTQTSLDLYFLSSTAPHTLVQKKTVAPPYNSHYITTANQSVRISDSLFATLRDVNDWVVYDGEGNYRGTIGLPNSSKSCFADNNKVYDSEGVVYAPAYSVSPDTNSIPNPKRKNLSAKFDILPDFLT